MYMPMCIFKNKEISKDEQINVVVPTVILNILLPTMPENCIPITLICASNENKVLYDFSQQSI